MLHSGTIRFTNGVESYIPFQNSTEFHQTYALFRRNIHTIAVSPSLDHPGSIFYYFKNTLIPKDPRCREVVGNQVTYFSGVAYYDREGVFYKEAFTGDLNPLEAWVGQLIACVSTPAKRDEVYQYAARGLLG